MIKTKALLEDSSKWISYILSGIGVTIFLLVAIPRFIYPFEVSWMEGSILDQIWHMLSGKALYQRPSIEYVPWLYQPLFYYVTAVITSITGLTFITARIPSFISSALICFVIYRVIKRETGSTPLSLVGISLFLTSFARLAFCLGQARVDEMFVALLLLATVVVYYKHDYKGLFLGAVLLVLSFYTKQTALFFFPGLVVYVLLVRGWKASLFFVGSFTLLFLICFWILDAHYSGWFSYYTLTIPRAKGKTLRWNFAIDGLFVFILFRCWLTTAIVALFSSRYLFPLRKRYEENSELFFAIFFAGGLFTAFMGILNEGGAHNVMLPIAVACGIFLPIAVSRFSKNSKYYQIGVWSLPIQVAFLLSYPFNDPRNLAQESDKTRQEQFLKSVETLSGEVWIPYHGYMPRMVGKTTYAELRAMGDVLLVGDSTSMQLQKDLNTALSEKKWSYILDDFQDTFPGYNLIEERPNLNKTRISDENTIFVFAPKNK